MRVTILRVFLFCYVTLQFAIILYLKMATNNLTYIDIDLLKEFECPVCTEHMLSPKFCKNGHGVCQTCVRKIEKCPICKDPIKQEDRCILLEKLIDAIMFPCKHEDRGCNFFGKGNSMKEHLNYCEFIDQNCVYYQTCTWKGHRKLFIEHLEKTHHQCYYEVTTAKITCFLKRWAPNSVFIKVFNIYKELFLFVYTTQGDFLKWEVYLVSYPKIPKMTNSYFAEVKLNCPVNKKLFSIKASCPSINLAAKFSSSLINNESMQVHNDVFKHFLEKDGSLTFNVEIFEKKMETH